MKKTVFLALFTSLGLWGASQVGAQTFISTDLHVGFPLEAAVQNGAIRVLIPTATDSANVSNTSGQWNGGTPVLNAFAAPSDPSAVTVTCPTNVTGFSFQAPTKQIGTIFYDPATDREISQAEAAALAATGDDFVRYMAFTCHYTGTGGIGNQFASVGAANNIVIGGLLNPGAATSGSLNEAIVLPGKVQLLSEGYTSGVASGLVSDVNVLISALTQDVLVTAKVDSQLMFRIDPVAEAASACGGNVTTMVGSNALLVDYGSPTVGSFVDAAQQIFIDSSAPNGYRVLAEQNHPLAKIGAICSSDGLVDPTTINRDCIPNYGWAGAQTPTAASAWSDPANTGFGYTVAAVTATTPGSNTPVADAIFANGTNYARFATRGMQDAYSIAASAGIAKGDVYDVCYRLSVDAQNHAGLYENAITYTITASF